MGLVFLLHSAAWGIAEALPVWAGYLIVGVVVLVLAAILGLMGKKSLETARPAPERAIDQAQQTIAVLKKSTDATDSDTAGPTTAGPSTAGPSTAGPSTAGPTAGPGTTGPGTPA